MSFFNSSNPALNNAGAIRQLYDDAPAMPAQATLQGVVNKTAILTLIALVAGGFSYTVLGGMMGVQIIAAIAAFVIVIGAGFLLTRNPALAKVVGPIYALVEGIFLGSFTAAVDGYLASAGAAVAGGVALQAFIVTASIFCATLGLYRAGVLRATPTFKKFIYIAVGGIMLTYVVSFIVMLLPGDLRVPFVSLPSPGEAAGWKGFIGLGINLVILLVAAGMLVLDFDRIEKVVDGGGPRNLEWYLAFGLLVTLAWIYFEAVKIVARVALMFANRD